MEIKDFETSSVTADSSIDSESEFTCVTETQYEISADNLLDKPDDCNSETDGTSSINQPPDESDSKVKHKFPIISSPNWYIDKCFNRYWRHYHQMMNWYQKHLRVYRTLQRQYCQNYNGYFCQGVQPYQSKKNRGSNKKHKNNANQKTKKKQHHKHHLSTGNHNQSGMKSESDTGAVDLDVRHDEPMSGTEATEEVMMDKEEEFEMEITDDMLQFFATSQQHRKERDAKNEMTEGSSMNTRVNIEDVHKQVPTVEAPKERPGVRRTAEMKLLYGKGAAMIHGMETAIQMSYDRNTDIKQPKVWPNIPLRITFAD